jgi:hypothetical protein
MVEAEIEDWPRPIFQPTFRPVSLAVPFEELKACDWMANEIFPPLVLTRIKARLPGNKRINKGNNGSVSIVDIFVPNMMQNALLSTRVHATGRTSPICFDTELLLKCNSYLLHKNLLLE